MSEDGSQPLSFRRPTTADDRLCHNLEPGTMRGRACLRSSQERHTEIQGAESSSGISRSSLETAKPSPASDSSSAPDSSTETLSTFRTAILNFSSQWFLVPQGLGITSVVLNQLQNRFHGLDIISYILWASTAVSLVLALLLYATRIAMFPRHVLHLLGTSPNELACISSISIAFTPINQMIALNVAPTGSRWITLTVVFWWLNVAMAVGCMIFIPFAFAHIHAPSIANLAPSTQLPMVASITLAAGGGVVAAINGLGSPLQVPILVVSYFALALAMPVAMTYTTTYLARLLDGSPPTMGKVYQEMIFCGPWGQGSFALQALGNAMVRTAPGIAGYTSAGVLNESAFSLLGYSSIFFGFMSWSAGTFWWAFAVMSTVRTHFRTWMARRRARLTKEPGTGNDGKDEEGGENYTLTVWALVFPWGVYTNAAVELGKLLGSTFFRIWSTVLAVCLVIIMLVNLGLTARGLWTGTLLGTAHIKRSQRSGEKIPA